MRTTTTIALATLLTASAGCDASPYRCGFGMDPVEYLGDVRYNVDLDSGIFDICAESTVPNGHEFIMEGGFTYSFRVIADAPIDIRGMRRLQGEGFSCDPFLHEDANHCIEIGYDCVYDDSTGGRVSDSVPVLVEDAEVMRVAFWTREPEQG